MNTFSGSIGYIVFTFSTAISTLAQDAPAYHPMVPEPTFSTIGYGEHERNVLDFWKAESNEPTPLVFVIHGGGWKGGEKERIHRFVDVQQLLDAEISVVAINYRLMKHANEEGVTPPVMAPMYDAARALQFVRNKAETWNIDKERIGAAGGSAGACTSLWLAYHDDLADPDSKDPVARESTRLWCAAVVGPQTTLDPRQMREWTPNSRYGGHAFGIDSFEQFFAERDSILPWILEYSPYALVSADDPPVYLYYTAPPALGEVQKDPTHSANFGLKLQERCESAGVGCVLQYPNATNVQYGTATEYLITTLKRQTSTPRMYSDARPEATLRMDAQDHGIVLRYGDGPEQCDILGARDVWVFEADGRYYMHYDAAGPKGWLSALATSNDLVTWEKKGPILDFGKAGEDDAAGACYGVTYYDGKEWHMFYLGTPNASSPPDLIPSFPYLTLKAKGSRPSGPWVKQKSVVPFRTKEDTYYSITASPGQIIRNGEEYLQFFSSTTRTPESRYVQRTLGIARTQDLEGSWSVDPEPVFPMEEQIENASLYFEESINTWFLFTNHVGIDAGKEFTDAIWVYWSKDLNRWDKTDKAVVLDGDNCSWSNVCIGLPSTVKAGNRLALFYDAPGGNSTSHMRRNIGLAWLNLPLSIPDTTDMK